MFVIYRTTGATLTAFLTILLCLVANDFFQVTHCQVLNFYG